MLNRLAYLKDQAALILYGEEGNVCNDIVSQDGLRHFDVDDESVKELDADSRARGFISK